MCVGVYIYNYDCLYIYIFIYLFIYIEREMGGFSAKDCPTELAKGNVRNRESPGGCH